MALGHGGERTEDVEQRECRRGARQRRVLGRDLLDEPGEQAGLERQETLLGAQHLRLVLLQLRVTKRSAFASVCLRR